MPHPAYPDKGLREFVRSLPRRTATAGVACCLMAAMAGSAQTLIGTRTFGGSGSDVPSAVASDAEGNIYIAGSTTSPDFPVTKGLYSQLPEPALRVSIDGQVFLGANLSAVSVNSVAVSSNGGLVLAGAPTGLYASRNSGKMWSVSTAIPGEVLAVAIDPTNAANAYAVAVATHVMATPASPENVTTWTIYKSTDAGATWPASTPFTVNPVTALVSRITIDPLAPSNVFAYVNSALMRSADAGASWQTVNIPASRAPGSFTNPTGFAIDPSQSGVAYATTFYTPLMKTSDGGNTWQSEAQIQSAGENAIAVDPRNSSVIWLVNGAGVQRSMDGGATFSPTTTVSNGDGSWRSIVDLDRRFFPRFCVRPSQRLRHVRRRRPLEYRRFGSDQCRLRRRQWHLHGWFCFANSISRQARSHADADSVFDIRWRRKRVEDGSRFLGKCLPCWQHAIAHISHYGDRARP